MNEIGSALRRSNELARANDALYNDLAQGLGLNVSAFWVLYTIRESNGEITQRDIVQISHFPPQTVNTALKKLEAEGYVSLSLLADKRKKQVRLTPKGEALARKKVDPVFDAEQAALLSLPEDERNAMLVAAQKHYERLKINFATLLEKMNE